MERKIESFGSSDGKSEVAAYFFETPSADPRAVVQISHGMCEHLGRYEAFARYLNDRGIFVCGNDHLGHGLTSGTAGMDGYFADRDGRFYVLHDLKQMNRLARARYGDIPVILLGHSMGSFFARWFACEYPDGVDGLILSGTGGPSAMIRLGVWLSALLVRLYGPRHVSSFLQHAGMGSYVRRIENPVTEYDWISRDEQVVRTYAQDPKCTFPFTAGAYHELLTVHAAVNRRSWARQIRRDLPIYLFSGDQDPVGDYGRGVETVFARLCQAGIEDVTCRIYPGGRHEMLNEINREQVFEEVADWCVGHFC